MSDSLSFIEFC